jgi:hypothetical protein
MHKTYVLNVLLQPLLLVQLLVYLQDFSQMELLVLLVLFPQILHVTQPVPLKDLLLHQLPLIKLPHSVVLLVVLEPLHVQLLLWPLLVNQDIT